MHPPPPFPSLYFFFVVLLPPSPASPIVGRKLLARAPCDQCSKDGNDSTPHHCTFLGCPSLKTNITYVSHKGYTSHIIEFHDTPAEVQVCSETPPFVFFLPVLSIYYSIAQLECLPSNTSTAAHMLGWSVPWLTARRPSHRRSSPQSTSKLTHGTM